MVSMKSFIFFSLLLVMVGGCAPKELTQPAPEILPSRVVTSEGMRYEVSSLRIPGTKQELKLKSAGTTTWIPLSEVSNIRFSGPILEQYRPARIFLIKGGRLEGELFVDFILEGTSDQGYWNMPVSKVESVDLAFD
jgi:hypothetical protein